MTTILRAVAAILAAGALSFGATSAPASASPDSKAATPTVKYKDVKVKCQTVTFDGVPSKQCQAMATVAASRVAPGYVITLFQKGNGYSSKLLSFEATGPNAQKRTQRPGVVCRTSGSGEVTFYKVFTVVKDASGKTVLRTKPAKLC